MPLERNRRKSKVPSWVGCLGDMKTPQVFLSRKRWLSGWFPIKFINSFFRSLGTVAFANNPLTGSLIFIGMCLGNTDVALASILASFTALFTCKMLSVSDDDVSNGLSLFNSILVGAITVVVAPNVFGTQLNTVLWIGIAVAAFITVIVDQGLNALMSPSTLPAQSVPFNIVIVTLMIIISMNQPQHLAVEDTGSLNGDLSQFNEETENSTDDIITLVNATKDMDVDWKKVWNGVLLSSGQIFGVGTPTSSVFIWLAFFLYSPLLTTLMACGASIGSVFAALTVPSVLSEVYQGVWGYNSLLAAGGIVFFNVPSPVCVIVALANAFITVCVQIALLPLFSSTNMPVFSYPFNVAIMVVLAISLKKDSPMILVTDFSLPEFHLYQCYADLNSENISINEQKAPLNEKQNEETQLN